MPAPHDPPRSLVLRRRAQLDRVLSEIWKRHKLPEDEAERARLADHSYLYGPDGLPR